MSNPPSYLIAALDSALHRRVDFDCGETKLNRYFREQASQDMKRKVAGCWVIASSEEPEIPLGYYTLSPEAVEMEELQIVDPKITKRLPRYPRVGAFLLGRLAVAIGAQKMGLGELLLLDAIHRVMSNQIPAALMVTDPKDATAEAFYLKYGFIRLNTQRFYITMQHAEQITGRLD